MPRIANRVPNVFVKLEHESPAYMDEVYPITICVSNDEAEPVQALLDMDVKSEGIEGEGMSNQPNFRLVYPGIYIPISTGYRNSKQLHQRC
jgi:hypothetical protein